MGSQSDYDVVIVGGGPAGTSAAIHLAGGGARVLLAEQEKFPRAKLCGEFVSPECLDHFMRLGVMDGMVAAGGVEITETVFYSRRGRSVSVSSAWLGGGGSYALGLSRAEMDNRLMLRARAAGVEVLEGSHVSGPLIEEGRVRGVRLLTHPDGELTYRAPITIDATGRSRALARHIEKEASKRGRLLRARAPLVAFKAHLEGARGAERTCEIYFYRGGYGGLSPVEDGRSNLCFIVSAQDVRARESDATRVMREVVASNRRAAQTLSEASLASEWLSVALESFGLRDLVPARGLMTVGDAASFIDPFTGSGMLMALESGELAAEMILRRLPDVHKEGAFAALAGDYRARYGERFGARLRLCAWLRRAAFAPQRAAEAAIWAMGASARLRRRLARATRRQTLSEHPIRT